ncbi:MAG: transglycosylase family protein, partial [Nakamurella sp.]
MRRTLALLTTLVTAATGLLITTGVASADPSPSAWDALRRCESSGKYDINTGNGYYGAYQFDLSTWRSVGGSGYPNEASPAEQDYRALYLYRMRGWQPWTCARIAGLSEDGDARSRVVPTFGGSTTPTPTPPPPPTTPSTPGTPTSGTPAYPGRAFTEGDSSNALVAWQQQM